MNLLPEVAAYLAKARHALEVAGKLQAAGELADAAGKAYYAMFYAAQALLRAHGIEVVKHSAVASMLGRHFAKTGRLGPEFHRMFLNARRVREIADYSLFEKIVESSATFSEDVVAPPGMFMEPQGEEKAAHPLKGDSLV